MTASVNKAYRHHNREPKLRRDKTEGSLLEHKLIVLLGILSALMLGISLSILNPETGPLANLKILLVTCSAGLVAYAVNRFAIERGTALAALGYVWSGIASVIAMLLVGAGMFIGAYSGLIYKSVEARVLIDNGAALNATISQIDQSALMIKRVGPALRLVADDLASYAECERTRSCLSRNGLGGFGPVAAETQKLSQRSDGIAIAFEQGETEHQKLLKDVNRLNRRYQEVLAEQDKDLTAKRAVLQGIHSEITQASMALSEALPVSLFNSYTQELLSGVSIAGQRESTKSLNLILQQHGETLSNVLDAIEDNGLTTPAFPSPPGMLGALQYIAEFAAFAAVIFVAELVLPITLWVLTYQKLVWEIDRRLPPRSRDKIQSGFGDLIDLPPVRHQPRQPQLSNSKRRTSSGRRGQL